jgi:hypothetical protein
MGERAGNLAGGKIDRQSCVTARPVRYTPSYRRIIAHRRSRQPIYSRRRPENTACPEVG